MTGLTEQQVLVARGRYGKNVLRLNERKRFLTILGDLALEPMFLLLIAACVLYFILGENTEGFMMFAALCFVSAISVFQEVKSSNALETLQQLTEPKVRVMRDGAEKELPIEDLVPGDVVLLDEGNKVPADAEVISANDLSVNESVITGESLPVEKDESHGNNRLYQGTVINSGRCMAKITATGAATTLGKIGKSITTYAQAKTELQQQVNVFFRLFAFFGIAAFFVIFAVNYINNRDLVSSLLFGLTLAMSAIPEEIPVAFSSFMALGAYHMSKLGIITRQPQTIENLGAVSIICLDKTGTITENKMQVADIYDLATHRLLLEGQERASSSVLYYALLASEVHPFDAMEKAIEDAAQQSQVTMRSAKLIGEYALHGRPPMMTHVYEMDGRKIAAAKGAVERIVRVCRLKDELQHEIGAEAQKMGAKGFRVLAVCSAIHGEKDLPTEQDDFDWKFEGLVSFYDPPRPMVNKILEQFYQAGITVKLLTGDFAETAMTISNETGLKNSGDYLTGEWVMQASPEDLRQNAIRQNIFARMYPEAKLKLVRSLIQQGDIVAMTGDGVNDAPALKAANIGIALGKRGTEVARQSADLIITDDDLQKLADAIRQGRKIFANIKKAIRYVISIHIPIILIASLPVLLGWKFPNIFTPIHVIFLELIMGPTCSIFFEREPVEETIMHHPPRKRGAWLFTASELFMSLFQGLVISSGILMLYYVHMNSGSSIEEVRTLVFTTLVISNIFLTFVNRSFEENILHTIRFRNNLALPVIFISVGFIAVIHLVPFVRHFFGMTSINAYHLLVSFGVALLCVGWFELYKTFLPFLQRSRRADHKHIFQ